MIDTSLPLFPEKEGYKCYALNIDQTTKRINYKTYDIYGNIEDIRVNDIPEGDITNYLYINGEFVFDPLPEPEPELDPIEVLQSEVAELKSQNEMLTECLLEVSEEIYN